MEHCNVDEDEPTNRRLYSDLMLLPWL
ncbi:unnamed protein product, partial [Cuscuta campestris]